MTTMLKLWSSDGLVGGMKFFLLEQISLFFPCFFFCLGSVLPRRSRGIAGVPRVSNDPSCAGVTGLFFEQSYEDFPTTSRIYGLAGLNER